MSFYAVGEVITLLGAEGDGTEWKGDHYAMTTHIINCCRVLTHAIRVGFQVYISPLLGFDVILQEVVGEDVVCVLVGNKTDLLEDRADQESTVEHEEDRQMTVTLTRHPHRVLTTDAMKLAQVLY